MPHFFGQTNLLINWMGALNLQGFVSKHDYVQRKVFELLNRNSSFRKRFLFVDSDICYASLSQFFEIRFLLHWFQIDNSFISHYLNLLLRIVILLTLLRLNLLSSKHGGLGKIAKQAAFLIVSKNRFMLWIVLKDTLWVRGKFKDRLICK